VDHRAGCVICGARVVYGKNARRTVCHYCGRESESDARCSKGHYVCDECHSLPAKDIIARCCKASKSKDPLALALTLMRNPAVKMHGPEHHFLVPAVLICAYHNVKGDCTSKSRQIDEASRRAQKVSGGFCGFQGACGTAVGTGIFVSVVTGATPLSKEEWRLANLMTARSLFRMAEHGGPRCCKRVTYLAIGEAVAFSAEKLGVDMKKPGEINCQFRHMNQECQKGKCPFYGKAE